MSLSLPFDVIVYISDFSSLEDKITLSYLCGSIHYVINKYICKYLTISKKINLRMNIISESIYYFNNSKKHSFCCIENGFPKYNLCENKILSSHGKDYNI